MKAGDGYSRHLVLTFCINSTRAYLSASWLAAVADKGQTPRELLPGGRSIAAAAKRDRANERESTGSTLSTHASGALPEEAVSYFLSNHTTVPAAGSAWERGASKSSEASDEDQGRVRVVPLRPMLPERERGLPAGAGADAGRGEERGGDAGQEQHGYQQQQLLEEPTRDHRLPYEKETHQLDRAEAARPVGAAAGVFNLGGSAPSPASSAASGHHYGPASPSALDSSRRSVLTFSHSHSSATVSPSSVHVGSLLALTHNEVVHGEQSQPPSLPLSPRNGGVTFQSMTPPFQEHSPLSVPREGDASADDGEDLSPVLSSWPPPPLPPTWNPGDATPWYIPMSTAVSTGTCPSPVLTPRGGVTGKGLVPTTAPLNTPRATPGPDGIIGVDLQERMSARMGAVDTEELQEQVARLLRREEEQRLQQQVYEYLTPPPQSVSRLHPAPAAGAGAKGKTGWPVQKAAGEGGGKSTQPKALEANVGIPNMQKQVVVHGTSWQLPMEPVAERGEQEERPETSPLATPRQLEVHTVCVLVCLCVCARALVCWCVCVCLYAGVLVCLSMCPPERQGGGRE